MAPIIAVKNVPGKTLLLSTKQFLLIDHSNGTDLSFILKHPSNTITAINQQQSYKPFCLLSNEYVAVCDTGKTVYLYHYQQQQAQENKLTLIKQWRIPKNITGMDWITDDSKANNHKVIGLLVADNSDLLLIVLSQVNQIDQTLSFPKHQA